MIDLADESVFFGEAFTEPCVFTAKEGAPVPTRGMFEDVVMGEDNGEYADRVTRQPHITVGASVGSAYGEGDKVEVRGRVFTILDKFEDAVQISFSLEDSF